MVGKELESGGFRTFEVQGRSKHLWSIYRKMTTRNIDFEQIFDVIAFRVIVDSIQQCYEVLGHVHALWKPYRDVSKISSPCQSEQLPVFAYHRGRTGGEQIEIQIRTKEMHLIAERGIAAH